jgi:hypothetical protein
VNSKCTRKYEPPLKRLCVFLGTIASPKQREDRRRSEVEAAPDILFWNEAVENKKFILGLTIRSKYLFARSNVVPRQCCYHAIAINEVSVSQLRTALLSRRT